MSVSFGLYAQEDWPGLLQMYLTFEPKAAYLGLPPSDEGATRTWLSGLVEEPKNTNLILKLHENVIAHAALVHYPNNPGEEEIIIFVHQSYQHWGWGRKLLLAAMNWACRQLELERVWLLVQRRNVPARRLFLSTGFVEAPEETDGGDIEMARPLQCYDCLKQECPIFTAELMRVHVPV